MSATLDYAATHYPEMVDIPSIKTTPMSAEDEKMFEEISEALAQKAWSTFRGKKTIAPHKRATSKKSSIRVNFRGMI